MKKYLIALVKATEHWPRPARIAARLTLYPFVVLWSPFGTFGLAWAWDGAQALDYTLRFWRGWLGGIWEVAATIFTRRFYR